MWLDSVEGDIDRFNRFCGLDYNYTIIYENISLVFTLI